MRRAAERAHTSLAPRNEHVRTRRAWYAAFVLATIGTAIAFAILSGPLGPTGLEGALVAASFALALGVWALAPRPSLYFLGLAALALAFVVAVLALRTGTWPAVTVLAAFAVAWSTLWASAARWWLGPVAYIGLGIWTFTVLVMREGADFLVGVVLDIDQFVHGLLVPILIWPSLVVGFLGLFGVVFR